MKKIILPIVMILGIFIILGVVSAECTDSDGGINYYVYGSATDNNSNFFSDGCLSDGSTLEEAACIDGKAVETSYKCLDGCKDGACVQNNSTLTCIDSDGLNYYIKGSVKDYLGERFDYCKESDGESYVSEYFCSGKVAGYKPFLCVNGCKDGACIQNNQCNVDSDCVQGCPTCGVGVNCPCYPIKCINGLCRTESTCQPTKCEDGTMTECKESNGVCSCSSCPSIPVCKPKFTCEGNYIPKCKLEGNECVCESCPGIPIDMQSCLNDLNNYWDQETNSCRAGFNDDMIKYSCSDPDGGRNFYQYAHTYGFRFSYADDKDKRIRTGGSDSCLNDGQLIEHYCDENGFIQTEYFQCPNGCKDSACIKGEQVVEKITCKFEGTNKEEQCYLAGQWGPDDEGTKFCKADAGSGSCVIAYSGYKGEQITWKSTCGQYQYTTQDGSDEVIYFKCNGGETNISEIKNKGFKFAYWQCYDGNEQKSEDTTSCKLSETWQKYAKDYCNDKCKGEKCGVNTFSVSKECYTDEISSTEVFSETGVLIKPKESILDSESVLICKDSCPLENKCYPFGYRKGGNYCSDENKFVEQLKGDKTCDNNFECSSNVCVSGKCISEGLIEKILNWFKKLFGG